MDVAQRRSILLMLISAWLVFSTGGCAIRREPVALDQKPLLIHLPGIGGDNAVEQWFLASLRTGGFVSETRLIDWPSRSFWITVLREVDRNRSVARALAADVARFAADNPTRPIFILSESGGAGPAVWLLEALPPNVQVEGVVLLSPALSPDYDLSPALAHVRHKMLVFVSRHDTLVLGWGTRTFGTIDGKRVAAAGSVGFTMPPDAVDPSQYAKLHTVPYDRRWYRLYGHNGDHTGVIGTKFASGFLAPMFIQLTRDALAAAPTTKPTGYTE